MNRGQKGKGKFFRIEVVNNLLLLSISLKQIFSLDEFKKIKIEKREKKLGEDLSLTKFDEFVLIKFRWNEILRIDIEEKKKKERKQEKKKVYQTLFYPLFVHRRCVVKQEGNTSYPLLRISLAIVQHVARSHFPGHLPNRFYEPSFYSAISGKSFYRTHTVRRCINTSFRISVLYTVSSSELSSSFPSRLRKNIPSPLRSARQISLVAK